MKPSQGQALNLLSLTVGLALNLICIDTLHYLQFIYCILVNMGITKIYLDTTDIVRENFNERIQNLPPLKMFWNSDSTFDNSTIDRSNIFQSLHNRMLKVERQLLWSDKI